MDVDDAVFRIVAGEERLEAERRRPVPEPLHAETGERGGERHVGLAKHDHRDVGGRETRIGRAEIKLPVVASEALRIPPDLGEALRARDFAIEDLHVQQFLVTTQVPATGRTDQLYVQDLHLQTPALVGPWRVEGTSGGVPFRAVSGTPGSR